MTTAELPSEASDKSDQMTATAEERPLTNAEPDAMEQIAYQDDASSYVDGDHVQSCFDRYRSYHPEDNSYQPFDGGPRRQCR